MSCLTNAYIYIIMNSRLEGIVSVFHRNCSFDTLKTILILLQLQNLEEEVKLKTEK